MPTVSVTSSNNGKRNWRWSALKWCLCAKNGKRCGAGWRKCSNRLILWCSRPEHHLIRRPAEFSQGGTPQVIPHNMTSTSFDLEGYRVSRTLGVVRGIIVRSRSVFGTIGAGLQTLVGGNITLLSDLCERTREESFSLMLQHAEQLGANAVIGIRYDATEVMQGVTEVLAYGTAV